MLRRAVNRKGVNSAREAKLGGNEMLKMLRRWLGWDGSSGPFDFEALEPRTRPAAATRDILSKPTGAVAARAAARTPTAPTPASRSGNAVTASAATRPDTRVPAAGEKPRGKAVAGRASSGAAPDAARLPATHGRPSAPPAAPGATARPASPAASTAATKPGTPPATQQPASNKRPAEPPPSPMDILDNPLLSLDKPVEDGFDPYNTGAFNRSASWERISRRGR